jgi:putative ABC transport system permease protein
MIRRGLLLGVACFWVASLNLAQHKLRLFVALSGIAVALLLLVLQIGMLDAARTKITLLFDYFNFDLVIVPDTYQFLFSFGTFNRVLLAEARAGGDVVQTFGLNINASPWTELPSKRMSTVFLIGLDDAGSFVRDPSIRAGLASLVDSHSILIDAFSEPDTGPVAIGTEAKIADEKVVVAGQFKLGLFFYAEGSAIVRNTEFARYTGRDPRNASIGLLQLAKGVDPGQAKARLAKLLPDKVQVLTHDELIQQERAYFLSTKPLGILLYVSMIIACLVGTVIMIQVLSTEVANRMKEYAVLKAMGSNVAFVYGIGLAQAALLGLGGLAPAGLLGAAILWFVEIRTHLPAALTLPLAGTALAITLGLAVIAGSAVLRRVEQADPAELF